MFLGYLREYLLFLIQYTINYQTKRSCKVVVLILNININKMLNRIRTIKPFE